MRAMIGSPSKYLPIVYTTYRSSTVNFVQIVRCGVQDSQKLPRMGAVSAISPFLYVWYFDVCCDPRQKSVDGVKEHDCLLLCCTSASMGFKPSM